VSTFPNVRRTTWQLVIMTGIVVVSAKVDSLFVPTVITPPAHTTHDPALHPTHTMDGHDEDGAHLYDTGEHWPTGVDSSAMGAGLGMAGHPDGQQEAGHRGRS